MPLWRKTGLHFIKNLEPYIEFVLYHYVLYLQFLSEVVGHYGSKGAEQRSQEDTDITDVNGDVKKV